MKKIIFILLTISSICCNAQVKIGVRAAGEMYWLGIQKQAFADGAYTPGLPLEGFSMGFTSEIKLNNKFSLKPEGLYNKSHGFGIYTYHTKKDSSFSDYVLIKQLQIPVLLKVNINKNGLYLLIGPSNSLISKEKKLYFDTGINAGIGITIPDTGLNLDLRYYRGFLPLDKTGYHQSFMNIGLSYLL